MAKKLFIGISEQSRAGQHRRDDASALFEKERWRGAMYLAGYAIECLLKTKLMGIFGCVNLDDLETTLRSKGLIADRACLYDHRLELYIRLAGALARLRSNRAAWEDFLAVNRWLPSWRYDPSLGNSSEAEEFLGSVDVMIRWFRANL